MAHIDVIHKDLDSLLRKIDKQSDQLKNAVEDALKVAQSITQDKTKSASAPYAAKGRKGYATGKMYRSIKSKDGVRWEGPNSARVGVGFDLKTGFHSIFIMYGTPRIKKDVKVWRAIRGTAVRREIKEKQREILERYLSFGGK